MINQWNFMFMCDKIIQMTDNICDSSSDTSLVWSFLIMVQNEFNAPPPVKGHQLCPVH